MELDSLYPKQIVFKRIGENGCYFLSLLRIAEEKIGEPVDTYELYCICCEKKFISPDCYIAEPAKLLRFITGDSWEVTFKGPNYNNTPRDVVIAQFCAVKGKDRKYHFVIVDIDDRVKYDPYGKSDTVANGKILDKRVFTIS